MTRRTLFLLILGILLIPQIALADGGVFIDYEKSVYLPSQKAVIAWDEASGEETLILSTQIKIEELITRQGFADAAWVVPVPSKTEPEVEEGDIRIFYDLADLFEGRRKATPWFGVEQVGDEGEVTVIAVKEVGIYDVAILKATGAEVLVKWLNDNGYVTPESAVPILQEYCEQEDFHFIANKIDLANKYWDLVVTETDRTCAQGVSKSVYPYMEISPATIDHLMSMNLTACENATLETVQTLVELDRGVATPLKITFSPTAPFYPLKISSLNEGETVVDVYVFSEEPVQDKSQLLTLSQMTENTASFGESYNLNQKYVTYLSYTGDLSDLSADAWFESRSYDRDLNPNYISFGGKIIELLGIALTFVLYVAYPAILIAVLGFAAIGFVVALKAIVNWFKRRRKK